MLFILTKIYIHVYNVLWPVTTKVICLFLVSIFSLYFIRLGSLSTDRMFFFSTTAKVNRVGGFIFYSLILKLQSQEFSHFT